MVPMPTADIYLRQNEAKVVSTLEVATGHGKDADVTVDPDEASMKLGGGGGTNSTGDVVLQDGAGDGRIQLVGGNGSKQDPGANRVFVDGADGHVQLGEKRTDGASADIEFTPKEGRARLGGGAGKNSRGELLLAESPGSELMHLDMSAAGPSGSATNVYLSGSRMTNNVRRQATRDSNVTIDGGAGLLSLGSRGQRGRLTVLSSSDTQGTFPTGVLDGGPGLLRVGGSAMEGQRGGVNGEIRARNGMGVDVFDVRAADGTVRVGSEGKAGGDRGAESGAVEVVHRTGHTTAELRGEEGSVVAGGKNTSGAVLLKHESASGTTRQYLLEANKNGLVVSTSQTKQGGSTVKRNEALRIEPDGTVRVKGGSVKPL